MSVGDSLRLVPGWLSNEPVSTARPRGRERPAAGSSPKTVLAGALLDFAGLGCRQNFFNARDASDNLARAVFAQQGHAPALSYALNGAGVRALQDFAADSFVDGEVLVNTDAAAVARAAALITARRPVKGHARRIAFDFQRTKVCHAWCVGFSAVAAQTAYKALCQHGLQRRRDKERLNAHVKHTRDGAGRVIGMQRGKHQVASE